MVTYFTEELIKNFDEDSSVGCKFEAEINILNSCRCHIMNYFFYLIE